MPEIQVSRTHRSRVSADVRRKAGVVAALSLGVMLAVVGVLASRESPVDDVVLRVPTSPGELPVVPDIPDRDRDRDGDRLVPVADDESETPAADTAPEVAATASDIDSTPTADPPRGPAVEVPVPYGPVDVPVPVPDPTPDPPPDPEPDPPHEPEQDLVRDLVDEITDATPATEPVGDAVLDVLDLLPDTLPVLAAP